MKVVNMNASLGALERTYELLELEVYIFHAYENAWLNNDKANDPKPMENFM